MRWWVVILSTICLTVAAQQAVTRLQSSQISVKSGGSLTEFVEEVYSFNARVPEGGISILAASQAVQEAASDVVIDQINYVLGDPTSGLRFSVTGFYPIVSGGTVSVDYAEAPLCGTTTNVRSDRLYVDRVTGEGGMATDYLSSEVLTPLQRLDAGSLSLAGGTLSGGELLVTNVSVGQLDVSTLRGVLSTNFQDTIRHPTITNITYWTSVHTNIVEVRDQSYVETQEEVAIFTPVILTPPSAEGTNWVDVTDSELSGEDFIGQPALTFPPSFYDFTNLVEYVTNTVKTTFNPRSRHQTTNWVLRADWEVEFDDFGGVLITPPDPEAPDGDGTEASPWLVSSISHLLYCIQMSQDNYADIYVRQTADIDLSETRFWKSDGDRGFPGWGELQGKLYYDGGGHKLIGLYRQVAIPAEYRLLHAIGLWVDKGQMNLSNVSISGELSVVPAEDVEGFAGPDMIEVGGLVGQWRIEAGDEGSLQDIYTEIDILIGELYDLSFVEIGGAIGCLDREDIESPVFVHGLTMGGSVVVSMDKGLVVSCAGAVGGPDVWGTGGGSVAGKGGGGRTFEPMDEGDAPEILPEGYSLYQLNDEFNKGSWGNPWQNVFLEQIPYQGAPVHFENVLDQVDWVVSNTFSDLSILSSVPQMSWGGVMSLSQASWNYAFTNIAMIGRRQYYGVTNSVYVDPYDPNDRRLSRGTQVTILADIEGIAPYNGTFQAHNILIAPDQFHVGEFEQLSMFSAESGVFYTNDANVVVCLPNFDYQRDGQGGVRLSGAGAVLVSPDEVIDHPPDDSLNLAGGSLSWGSRSPYIGFDQSQWIFPPGHPPVPLSCKGVTNLITHQVITNISDYVYHQVSDRILVEEYTNTITEVISQVSGFTYRADRYTGNVTNAVDLLFEVTEEELTHLSTVSTTNITQMVCTTTNEASGYRVEFEINNPWVFLESVTFGGRVFGDQEVVRAFLEGLGVDRGPGLELAIVRVTPSELEFSHLTPVATSPYISVVTDRILPSNLAEPVELRWFPDGTNTPLATYSISGGGGMLFDGPITPSAVFGLAVKSSGPGYLIIQYAQKDLSSFGQIVRTYGTNSLHVGWASFAGRPGLAEPYAWGVFGTNVYQSVDEANKALFLGPRSSVPHTVEIEVHSRDGIPAPTLFNQQVPVQRYLVGIQHQPPHRVRYIYTLPPCYLYRLQIAGCDGADIQVVIYEEN